MPIRGSEPHRLGVGDDTDGAVLLDLVDDDLAGCQRGVAGDDGHVFREAGQEDAFLAGAVAATHNGHVLVPIEGTVAGGTEMHACADEVVLALDSEPAIGRAKCEEYRKRGVRLAVPCRDVAVWPVHSDVGDFLRGQNLDAKLFGLST